MKRLRRLKNPRLSLFEQANSFEDITTYNNFYEFGTSKGEPAARAGRFPLRCVEAWSMVMPWVGFPLGDLLKRFRPTSRAKFVAFKTVHRPDEMPGQRFPVLEWPHVEGLRIDEAGHPLTILAVGLYGQALPNQNGAPLRLVVPRKYGFKGIKSIVEIRFAERQPPTSWNISAPRGFGCAEQVASLYRGLDLRKNF